METRQKQYPAVDVTGDRSKVQCCKDLDYHDIEWLALEMNRDHSVVFETASNYCISDSFVDYDGNSISLKGLLPAVVDIMVI